MPFTDVLKNSRQKQAVGADYDSPQSIEFGKFYKSFLSGANLARFLQTAKEQNCKACAAETFVSEASSVGCRMRVLRADPHTRAPESHKLRGRRHACATPQNNGTCFAKESLRPLTFASN